MKIWLMLLCCLFPTLAFAQKQKPLAAADEALAIAYTRTNILLVRKGTGQAKAETVLPWQNPQPQESASLVFDVELRNAASFFNQPGWFELSEMSDMRGVLFALAEPSPIHIPPANYFAPIDILFIDSQGVIQQIAPSMVLSQLEEPLSSTSNMLAFLLLRGGSCERLGIAPGDEIQHGLFKKSPIMLLQNAPASKEPAPAKKSPPVVLQP